MSGGGVATVEVEGLGRCYLHATCAHNNIRLLLHSGPQAWRATVCLAELAAEYRRLRLDETAHVAETRAALGAAQSEGDSFLYEFVKEGDKRLFVWKKLVSTDDIKVKLGQAELTPVDDLWAATRALVDSGIAHAHHVAAEARAAAAAQARMSADHASAITLLDSLAAAKESLEKELYAKFALVINSKKAKIRQLQQELKETSRPAAAPATPSKNAPARPESPASEEAESSTTEADVSDNEAPRTSPRPGASVKRRESSLSTDDSDGNADTQPAYKKQKPGPSVHGVPARQDSQSDALLDDFLGVSATPPPPRVRAQRRGTEGGARHVAAPVDPVGSPKTSLSRHSSDSLYDVSDLIDEMQ